MSYSLDQPSWVWQNSAYETDYPTPRFPSEAWTNSWTPHGQLHQKKGTKKVELNEYHSANSPAPPDIISHLTEKFSKTQINDSQLPHLYHHHHNSGAPYLDPASTSFSQIHWLPIPKNNNPEALNPWFVDHTLAPVSSSPATQPPHPGMLTKNSRRKSSDSVREVATPATTENGNPGGIEEELSNQNLYKTELCRSWRETGACRYGHKCQFAHGEHELRLIMRHPKYKTEPCKTYLARGFCPYSDRCRFLHPEDNSVRTQAPKSNSWYEESEWNQDSPASVSPISSSPLSTSPISSVEDSRPSERSRLAVFQTLAE